MPQRLSQFRDSSELVTSSVYVYLTDYGTISPTNYVANANLFRKAYNDVLRKRFATNDGVTAYIYCPPGDYYFGDNPSGNQSFSPLVLCHPQGANITIRSTVELDWANRPSNSALSGVTAAGRYALLSEFYQTRFHFARNGPVGRAPYTAGSRGGGGFRNIGIFGRYNGSPGTFNGSDDIYARGVTGSVRLENCCVQGFGVTNSTNPVGKVSINGWGLGADGSNSHIEAVNVQVLDCMRGYVAEGGTIKTFGDCCVIRNKDSGLLAVDGGVIYFAGEGSGYISNSLSYGAHAYSNSVIRFGNTTFGSHSVVESSIYSLRVDTKGLITGQLGKISYSNSQELNDGLIKFV